jgi:hypothetical protein
LASENISRGALSLTVPGYLIQSISGRLIGAKDLSDGDIRKLHLRGLTETWEFNVYGLTDIARTLWNKVRTNKWKIIEAGNSFSDLFPYGGSNSTSLIVWLMHTGIC